MRTRLIAVSILTIVFATAAVPRADMTIEQKGKMGGFLNSETKIITRISGDKQVVDTESKMKLPIVGSVKTRTLEYTRLDKGVIWEADPKEKTYTELSLDAYRKMMSMGMEFMSGGHGDMPEDEYEEDPGGEFAPEGVTMNPPEYSLEKTGKTETIADRKTEHWLMKMVTTGVNDETGDTVRFEFIGDFWMTGDLSGFEEYAAFNDKYAEAMGVTPEGAESMLEGLTSFGLPAEELKGKMKEMKGFPMKMAVTLNGAGDMGGGDAEGGGEGEPGMAEAKEAMKKLGGLFGGGKKKEEPADPNAPKTLMTFETVVTKLSTGDVADKEFDPNPKWKKIDHAASSWLEAEDQGGDE